MFTKFLSHLRQQSLGALALFIVLGGTSYAVASGSIDSREIKNSTIRGKDIRNNQVSTSDVRNGSLLSRDFKPGQLPAGQRGPAGPAGPAGVRGAEGAPGLSGLEFVSSSSAYNSANTKDAVATCPAGKRVVGGGASSSGSGYAEVIIHYNGPADDGDEDPETQWRAEAVEAPDFTATDWVVRAFARCAYAR